MDELLLSDEEIERICRECYPDFSAELDKVHQHYRRKIAQIFERVEELAVGCLSPEVADDEDYLGIKTLDWQSLKSEYLED